MISPIRRVTMEGASRVPILIACRVPILRTLRNPIPVFTILRSVTPRPNLECAAALIANPAWTSAAGAAHRPALANVFIGRTFPRVALSGVSGWNTALRDEGDETDSR